MCITGEGGKSIKCYSVLLSNFSPLVKGLLNEQGGNNSHQLILPDFSIDDILHVMKLVYSGK